MDPNEIETFPTAISIGGTEKLPSRAFASPADAARWVDQEYSFYSDAIGNFGRTDAQIAEGWGKLQKQFARVRERLKAAVTAKELGRVEQVLSEFAKLFDDGKLISSETVAAHSVRSVAQENGAQGARVLLALSDVDISAQNSQSLAQWARAGAIAEAIQRGWIDARAARDGSFESFRANWDSRLQALEQTLHARSNQLASIETHAARKKRWPK